MTSAFRLFFGICVFALLFCCSGNARATTCPKVLESIQAGQDWFVNAQRPNGLFTYQFFPFENRVGDDDNVVRQMGSFWALVETLDYNKNDEVLQTIDNFREKIGTMIIRSKAGDEDIAYIEFEGIGKLNTSALYVLSLMSLVERNIELTEQEKKDLPLFVRGLRLMYDEKGGFFYIYYVPAEHNRITPYGSGEALFALAKYYEYTGELEEMKWLYGAFNQYYDRFLKDEEDFYATPSRAFFSWSIYALEIINQHFPIEYDQTVKQLLRLAWKKRAGNPKCRDNGCILAMNVGDGTFFEGMVQAYKMALQHETDPEEIQKIRSYIDMALSNFMGLQILDVENFQREFRYMGKPEAVRGALCWSPKCTYIRNDATQHVISAFIYYADFFCRKEVEALNIKH